METERSSSSLTLHVSLSLRSYTAMRMRPLRCMIILTLALTLANIVSKPVEAMPGMPGAPAHRHFVLVHGAGHGAWCWYKVHALLQKAGQKVTSFDLTSGGLDPTDANTVLTFEDYNKPLTDFLHSLPTNEKVVLVGHSVAGLSLTHAIHLFGSNKIGAAVFVGAVMLRSGFMSVEDIQMGLPNLSQLVNLVLGKGPDKSPIIASFVFRPELVGTFLYNESPDQDIVLALSLLKPAPFYAIHSARFNSTNVSDVDRVPRVYVKTRFDRSLKPELQDAMIRKWPPSKVVSVDSDHCPFFSAPNQLVYDVLLKI